MTRFALLSCYLASLAAAASNPVLVDLQDIVKSGNTYDGITISINACAHVSKHGMYLSPCGKRAPILLLFGRANSVVGEAYAAAGQTFNEPLRATFIGVCRTSYPFRDQYDQQRIGQVLLLESLVNPSVKHGP